MAGPVGFEPTIFWFLPSAMKAEARCLIQARPRAQLKDLCALKINV